MRYKMWTTAAVLALVPMLAGCATTPDPPLAGGVERMMEVTAYCDCGRCCNWKRNWLGRPVIASGPNKGDRKDVGRTASGAMARRGTIAADTRNYPFGTRMYIPGYGEGVVQDRGSAITGNKIDVFFHDHDEALRWGRQHVPVRVYL